MKTGSSPAETSTGNRLPSLMTSLPSLLAELGNISDAVSPKLIMGLRGLPEFLVANPGLTPAS